MTPHQPSNLPRRRLRALGRNAPPAALTEVAQALDAFRNLAARTGWNTPSLPEATEYILPRLTFNYWLMITLYESHWLFRRIIDAPVEDMVRAWPTIDSELSPDDMKSFERTLTRMGIADTIGTVMKWANLFGGAGALMVINGHENALEEPLDLDTVNPGSFKGLIPFDRWSGIAPSGEIVSDFENATSFNLPEFYQIRSEQKKQTKVHHSRILRFTGPRVPQPEFQAYSRWGISKYELVYEEVRKRDNMSWAILNLMMRANIIAQKNKQLAGLMSGLNASNDAASKYASIMQAQNELLSNQSMLILPEDGGLETHQYTFGGIADVYQQFQLDIAGAADTPVTILFGRTLTGLGQSNDADMRIYEMKTSQRQKTEMAPVLEQQLYPVIMMSEFGEIPKDFALKFPAVRVLTEEEKADLAGKMATAISTYFNAGIFSHRMALKEVKETATQTGIGTNITDEDIARAPDDFPMAGEMGGEPGGGEPAPEAAPETSPDTNDMLALRDLVENAHTENMEMQGDTQRRLRSMDAATHWEPWIGVDLDGTLSVEEDQFSPLVIGRPVNAMVERVKDALANGKKVKVFTARVADKKFAQQVRKKIGDWTKKYVGQSLEATNVKDPGMTELWDNRARRARANTGLMTDAAEFVVHGFPVVVESQMGTDRYGGKLPAHYGYIAGTRSAEKNEEMDAFINPVGSDRIFVIDGYLGSDFDEHKVMFGYERAKDALRDFTDYYSHLDGRTGKIRQVDAKELREWLKSGDVTRPYAQ